MDKICIARRREKHSVAEQDLVRQQSAAEPVAGVVSSGLTGETGQRGTQKSVSMELTDEQTALLQSEMELSPGKACMVSLDTADADNGRVVFNFHLAPLYGGKMLSPEDVCKMLQIGKSSLARMVRTGQLESYKIGRLRRFLLEDVLHYLSTSKERV